ncbi:MAG: glycine cleavage system protein GcvH [Gammaproteobacteria bacterium]|nr:glycine cleavage system protein GcvH [Gammaproteobacteria bacterium]
MTHLPTDLKYASTHEWARLEADNIIRVGITDFAQQQLGDLVFIDLPEIGRTLSAGEQCAVVESVKTASDLHSPVTGQVIAVNNEITDELEQVNDDPYNAWLFCIKAADPADLDKLMAAEDYQRMIND